MTKLAALAVLVASLCACDIEKTTWRPQDEPDIAGSDVAQVGSACDESESTQCASGYTAEMFSADGKSWLCARMIGCPMNSSPCKYGEQAGDPAFQVRCRVER